MSNQSIGSKTKRILVTGGAGFLGSHLCERLVGQGHDVLCVDNFFTSQKTNVFHLLGKPNFELIRHDVTLPIYLEVDQVYHLACPAAPGHYQYNPIKTVKTSVMGAINVLGMAKRCGARVLQASTSEVYGKGVKVPFAEEDDLLLGSSSRSRWSYAASKLLDEFLGLAAHREYGLPVTVVRFFNTVGPGQTGRYGMVVPRFVRAALCTRPIPIFGDGKQSRCFCHVRDTVRAVIDLLASPEETSGQIYNIGSSQEVTIHELAQTVIDRTESQSSIEYIPYSEAYAPGFEDMRRRVPDTTKLHAAIGWATRYTLNQILDDVIEYERALMMGAI